MSFMRKNFFPDRYVSKILFEECSYKAKLKKCREYRITHKERLYQAKRERLQRIANMKKHDNKALDDKVRAAEAAGMTYGQYVIKQINNKERKE